MPSVIFESSACRHCDGKPLERQERRVLRTPTEDICCNCGEVLQTYPVPMQLSAAEGITLIPDQVTQALAKLLKTRLFELDREPAPELIRHNWAAIEKPPAHRIGDQMAILLRGRGNTSATIRWSYSNSRMLPLQRWQTTEWLPGSRQVVIDDPRATKPRLWDMEFPIPSRITRAREVLADFDLTEGSRDPRVRSRRFIRLEKRCILPASSVETIEEMTLVVKLQISWLHVGSRLPSEHGERQFVLGEYTRYCGYPLTLEEVVDGAVSWAMTDGKGDISLLQGDRTFKVATAHNPCYGKYHYSRGDALRDKALAHQSWLQAARHREDFQGPFRDDQGRLLVPTGLDYELDVQCWKRFDAERKEIDNECAVTVMQDDRVLVDKLMIGDKHPFASGTASGHPMGLIQHVRLKDVLCTAPGKTLVTRITDADGGTEELTYLFVSWKQYNEAWDEFRKPFIDEYKRQLCGEILQKFREWNRADRSEIEDGAKVAALINGRWVEGVVAPGSATAHQGKRGHTVFVYNEDGAESWDILSVLPLEQALQAGLDVAPAFNPCARVGFAAVRT